MGAELITHAVDEFQATASTLAALVIGSAGAYGIYRIGDSGSKAAWAGGFSATETNRPGGPGHD